MLASVTDRDCDAPDLVYIGTTSFGTRVSVNPLAVGRKVICIGGTVHHLMAGYGGGRKSIVAGIASRETIRMNHERALDPEKPMTDVRVGSGLVENNPINLDMREAGAMVHVTFGINIVVDSIFPPQRFILVVSLTRHGRQAAVMYRRDTGCRSTIRQMS
ncbi:MAG: lactate racemase domain-containing protein [Clostridium fessum]